MESRRTAGLLAIIGLLVLAGFATALSHPGDRPMILEPVDMDRGPDATVVEYDALPPAAQDAVNEAIEEGWARLYTWRDHEAVDALSDVEGVRVEGTVHSIRLASADGAGSLPEGIARDLGLSGGGLLLGAAVVVGTRRRHPAVLGVVPAAAVAGMVGANAVTAPTPSMVDLLGNLAFGLAAAVPVLAGMALGKRDGHVAVVAAGTLALSVGALLAGDGTSALYVLLPLAVLAVPGLAFGWWLGTRLWDREG